MGVKNMVGKRFGRLTVVSRAANDKYGNAMWNCVCDCGKSTVIMGSSMRSGHAKSCGCLKIENTSKANRIRAGIRPEGYGKRLMRIFGSMKSRCLNPNNVEYSFYGGRGITICKEWLEKSSNFYEWALANGYKENLTIDRIDNDKGYSPNNCRFISRAEQNRNTSRVHKVLLKEGNYITTAQVAKRLGLSRSTTAQWYRKENVTTFEQFKARYEQMPDRYKEG